MPTTLSSTFGRASFDAIFSHAVIEHLAAPWIVAAELNRTLGVGGITAHTTHQTWCLHEAPNDFWRFSDQALRFLFGNAFGFEVIEVGMASPIVLLPDLELRYGPFLEMPFFPGFGEVSVMARKVRDIEEAPDGFPSMAQGEMLGVGRAYPNKRA